MNQSMITSPTLFMSHRVTLSKTHRFSHEPTASVVYIAQLGRVGGARWGWVLRDHFE